MDYNKINTLKLDSNNQLIGILSNHSEIIRKISRFQIAQERLTSNQKKLVELYALLSKDIGSLEQVKNDQRSELVKKTLPVITIMQIFAYDKKKKNLIKRLDYLTPEYLQICSDFELINISKKIWMIANKYGGYSLAFIRKIKSSLNADKSRTIIKLEKEYGLIPNMIKNIEEANIKFIEALLLYEDEMKEKDKIVRKIKKIDIQTDTLLENKIDRFVLLFQSENPNFFEEYQEARKIKFQRDAAVINNLPETKIIDDLTPAKDLPMGNNKVKQVDSQTKPKTPQRPKAAKKAGA